MKTILWIIGFIALVWFLTWACGCKPVNKIQENRQGVVSTDYPGGISCRLRATGTFVKIDTTKHSNKK